MTRARTQRIAIWAYEIREGMLVEHPHATGDRIRVTQVQSQSSPSVPGSKTTRTITVIGEHGDGSPFVSHCDAGLMWFCYEAPLRRPSS